MTRINAYELGKAHRKGQELNEEQDAIIRRDPELSREFWAGYRGESK